MRYSDAVFRREIPSTICAVVWLICLREGSRTVEQESIRNFCTLIVHAGVSRIYRADRYRNRRIAHWSNTSVEFFQLGRIVLINSGALSR